MEGEGNTGRRRPDVLAPAEPPELPRLPHCYRSSHDDGGQSVAPERDGQGCDRASGERGGDERAGRGHAKDAERGNEKGHRITL